ncbi:MAG: Hsp20/alpha crystallin family protein [Proteobacteria bacterium]|nr:Hsp20/alpha crystallin family protein [Pseudomonadota bacterium]
MYRNFSNAINRMLAFQNAVEAARKSDFFGRATTDRGSYPSVNLFQDGDDTVLTAEVPGLRKEDIKLEIKDNLIRLSGKRTNEYPEKSSVHRLERRNVSFDRTLKLPRQIEPGKIAADYKDGVLKVVLPRAERDKPKRIEIN